MVVKPQTTLAMDTTTGGNSIFDLRWHHTSFQKSSCVSFSETADKNPYGNHVGLVTELTVPQVTLPLQSSSNVTMH
eukprot:1194780-Amphidinium_carterae.1